MRFHCTSCGENMDSSLVRRDELLKYMSGRDLKVVLCPFCHCNTLEVARWSPSSTR